MNQKELFRLIDKYRSYKRFIKSDSITTAIHRLEESPKYGCERVLLEKEVFCWEFIIRVDNLTKLLPKTERQFVKNVLSINTYKKASASLIVKETGISSYKVKQFLDCVVAEFDQKEKRCGSKTKHLYRKGRRMKKLKMSNEIITKEDYEALFQRVEQSNLNADDKKLVIALIQDSCHYSLVDLMVPFDTSELDSLIPELDNLGELSDSL